MTVNAAVRLPRNRLARAGEYARSIGDSSEDYPKESNDGPRTYIAAPRGGVGDLDKAIADLDIAIRLDPKDADPPLCRRDAWGRKGEFDKAIADLLRSDPARLRPKDADRLSGGSRTSSGLDKEEYERAIKDYDDALRLGPKLAVLYLHRGYARLQLKDYDGAIADYDITIRLDPKEAPHRARSRGYRSGSERRRFRGESRRRFRGGQPARPDD